MDETLWALMNIVGPAILLLLLLWLVLRGRRTRRRNDPPQEITEQGARDAYAEEERMRRQGTDDVEPRG